MVNFYQTIQLRPCFRCRHIYMYYQIGMILEYFPYFVMCMCLTVYLARQVDSYNFLFQCTRTVKSAISFDPFRAQTMSIIMYTVVELNTELVYEAQCLCTNMELLSFLFSHIPSFPALKTVFDLNKNQSIYAQEASLSN